MTLNRSVVSEQITHLAVLDDCRRLAVGTDADRLADPLQTVLDRRHDSARQGSMSRGNKPNLIPMVKKAREYWDERAGQSDFERRFAFALGWHVHRATDRYFKPVYRELDPDYEQRDERWIKIFHDTVLFERVYDAGAADPFVEGTMEVSMGSHPASAAVDVPRVEPLFRRKWTVELVAAHEFVAGLEGRPPWDWVQNLVEESQTVYDHYPAATFEEAYADPDPALFQRFIQEPPFYDESDPIVRLARAVQRSEPVDVTLPEALADPGDSQYAEVLAYAFGFLETASGVFEGTTDELDAAVHYQMEWLYGGEDEWESPAIPDDADPAPHPRLRQSLTELAAIDDVANLTLWDESVTDRTTEALTDHRDAAALGALADPGEWMLEDSLDAARSRYHFTRDRAVEKLAAPIGALVARTVRDLVGDDPADDAAIARDAAILRARSHRRDPDAADAETLADLFEGLLPRARQRWHTLKPDGDAVEAWSARFFDWRDDVPKAARETAVAYATGAASEGFYDPEDPLIRLARAPAESHPTEPPSFTAVLSNEDPGGEDAGAATADGGRCTYAEILAEGVGHVRAIDAFVDKRDDGEAFRSRL